MEKKRAGEVALLAIGVLVAIFFVYQYFVTNSLVKEALVALEAEHEFCSDVVDKSRVSGGVELLAVCNSRPYSASYVDGSLVSDMNGWSFLKEDAALWSELENCNFYDSRKVGEGSYDLTFFCPKDFQSKALTAKVYRFEAGKGSMAKLGKKDFVEVLSSDIKKAYPAMKDCTASFFNTASYEGSSELWLSYACSDGDYIVLAGLSEHRLQPPVAAEFSSERISASFKKAFGCEPSEINSTSSSQLDFINIKATCNSREIGAYYFDVNPVEVSYSIAGCANDPSCISYFSGLFLIPKPSGSPELLSQVKERGRLDREIYRLGDDVIELTLGFNSDVFSFAKKYEGW